MFNNRKLENNCDSIVNFYLIPELEKNNINTSPL